MSKHEAHMERAVALARKGLGRTHPNPPVGCVLVRGGKTVGEGFHPKAGKPHAEAAAIRKAKNLAQGATAYVTLEPCNHQGRTGPCTEALIDAGVKRVFVGVKDPNPLVCGRGIRRLRRAGIEVAVGLCRAACEELVQAHRIAIIEGRPMFVAKLAMSLDGKVATRTGASQWITSPESRAYGHQLRNRLDAIMIGIGTVLADDPRLTCRTRGGRDPIRLVVDSRGQLPPNSHLARLAATSKAQTWLLTGLREDHPKVRSLRSAGVIVHSLPNQREHVDLVATGKLLGSLGLTSVLVEGGPTLVGAMFDNGLIDQVHAFIAPKIIGGVDALSAVGGSGAGTLEEALKLESVRYESKGSDIWVQGAVARPPRGNAR